MNAGGGSAGIDNDPSLIVPQWRALDLQRAYAYRRRELVVSLLGDLDEFQMADVVSVLVTNHNQTLTILAGVRGTDVGVRTLLRTLDEVAALAPADREFVVTTALRSVADGSSAMNAVLHDMQPADRAHALAIYITAANLAAFTRRKYQRLLEQAATTTAALGVPRPYPQPIEP